jgi:hypothetical protein
MCNFYSMTTNQKAIRDLFKVTRDNAGNLPPLPGIFPDYLAPLVRNVGHLSWDTNVPEIGVPRRLPGRVISPV